MYKSQKRKNKYLKKIIMKKWNILICPRLWFEKDVKKRKWSSLIFSVLTISYITTGIALYQYFDFPYFYYYTILFLTIGCIAYFSIRYFCINFENIISELTLQPFSKNATDYYYAHFNSNIIYFVFPALIIIIFGCGGCFMSSKKLFTPLIVWMLSLFTIVVYFSIVGYIQYIALFIFIRKLSKNRMDNIDCMHSFDEPIPADIKWLQLLTKLSHIYRGAFFSLGSLYIIAFSSFCWIPEMETNTSTVYYYILWLIIYIAIIFTFPMTAFIEYNDIKYIVKKIKKTYIKDLKKEIELSMKFQSNLFPIEQRNVFLMMYSEQIMSSKDYPIKSKLLSGYSILLSIFNFFAALITILQNTTTFLVVLPHMF